jgi:hypothetical protein
VALNVRSAGLLTPATARPAETFRKAGNLCLTGLVEKASASPAGINLTKPLTSNENEKTNHKYYAVN